MHQNITVSKLSGLQKQILVYARRVMIEKKQIIADDNNRCSLCLAAPQWLDEALTKALQQVFFGRKCRARDGEQIQAAHPWIEFFDEVAYVERSLRDAAKAAGKDRDIRLTELCKSADRYFEFILCTQGESKSYHPWPYHYGRGWYFMIDVELPASELAERMSIASFQLERGHSPTKLPDTVWLEGKSYDINCTIPARLLTIPKYYKYLSRETVTLTAMLLHTGDAVLNSPRFGCAACRRRFSL
jgi:hypothetical protein